MTIKTSPFDPADHLTSVEDQAELLSDAFASGNADYVANALRTIARARGMAEVARGAGITREGLYKALGKGGDPKLTTLVNVINTLGFTLSARPRSAIKATRSRKAAASRRSKKPERSAAAH
ncbi:MAG: putative addiction module antidote protein [Reyranella sp.]|jgi:probable addiction module antidote protein|uniref:addiction module antidote protein n=1 Tax=Reyranella sp. TaxID=1929291 RepID=UPI0009657555|nr:addiction module antidote protein [Reyranella sp.]MBN9541440.1 putative addiction module antidote protein [Alphaproteobacteria bacterium]MBR2814990.1 putative addiction module antidote protein [Reyranella sp.]OJU37538.1 MAG: putative addiction module antidote protein [Alphaproteobacteria bacterium 65-37]